MRARRAAARDARDLGFAPAWLFGAACPERDAGVAPVLPAVSTAAMNLPLAERGRVRSLAAFPWLPSCVIPS